MASIDSKIPYRDEFKKILNADNWQKIDVAFERFLRRSSNVAGRRLWNLTCDTNAIEATLKNLGLEGFPRKHVALLRDELWYQYERLHKGCFDATVIPKVCRGPYEVLEKHAGKVVAKAVFPMVQSTSHKSKRVIKNVLWLLNTREEKQYCGGLRLMRFTYEEATYLKAYRVEIRKLLASMPGVS